MSERKFECQVIVITGASSGFGKGAALEFARQGANVVLAARRDQALDELAQRCKALGGDAIPIQTDVSQEGDVERLARTALNAGGKIDVWINNAGSGSPAASKKFRSTSTCR
jgi:NADP-dependent 3-hydroxy acid dehydrogenase YdfG